MRPGSWELGKRATVGMLLAIFTFAGVGLAPSAVFAQAAVSDPATEAATALTAAQATSQTGMEAKTTAWDAVKITLANSAAIALLNASQYFVTRIAYDTANYVASGGKGQTPLFVTDWKKYAENTALDAAGEALGTFTQAAGLQAFGINLCNPTAPRVALNIKLGFVYGLGLHYGNQPQPKCNWNQVSKNWDSFTSQSTENVLDNVGVMFTPGQSSLSSALEFNRYSLELMSAKQQAAINQVIASSGFKDITDVISGQVKTPAAVVQQEMNRSGDLAGNQTMQNTMITGDAFQAGAYGVLSAALKTFTNTLTEKLMKRIFDRGLISAADLARLNSGDQRNALFERGAVVDLTGQAAAEVANAGLLTAPILSTTNYDPLLDLTSCPDGAKGPYNCAMDNRFLVAVNRASEGAPVTVSQAIEQGYLNGSWKLLPSSSPQNANRNCYQEAFCYSNLVKLRLNRIVPVGWELAANSAYNDPNNPVTLKQAMDRFNDCPTTDDGTGRQVFDAAALPSSAHPWCHLIDPDWVLKAPKAICRMMAPGPTLVGSNVATRASICVDAATCVQEDAKGNCQGGYGYCVREAGTWKIDADACEAQYASCQALSAPGGQRVAYNLNTVSAGVCNSDNAGCRAYSRVQNAIPNGGFEEGQRDWARGNGSVGVDTSGAAAHGTGAASVAGNGAWLGTVISPAPVVKLVAGKSYTASFSSRLSQPSATARAFMNINLFDENAKLIQGNVITQQTCGTATMDEPFDWQSLGGITRSSEDRNSPRLYLAAAPNSLGYTTRSCQFTVPAGAYYAQIQLVASGASGPVYFDDVALNGADAFSAAPLDSIFLNSKTEACSESQVGCRQFVLAAPGALNLLANSGFESSPEDQGLTPSYWVVGGQSGNRTADYQKGNGKSYEGEAAVRLSYLGFSQRVPVTPESRYTISAYARQDGGTAVPNASVHLTFYNSSGDRVSASPSTTCNRPQGDPNLYLTLPHGDDYERATCTFTVPAGAEGVEVGLRDIDADIGSNELVDAVQLELGETASAYHGGYAGDAKAVNFKVAPAGVTCNGNASDPAECAGYAKTCRQEEVGCELYAPKSGGTSIPAVTSSSDVCPAECVGYASFRQEPTSFADAVFPKFLIPSTAQQCSAAAAGCEEFTNLEKLARGGEAAETYTSLRLCQKPDDQTITYYAWEGNDLKGYQLQTWRLRQSNIASTNSIADPSGGIAPCTNLRYDAEQKPVCADTADNQATCSKAMMQFDPDCREFIDAAGNYHYRLYSRTILASDECVEFRATRSVQSDCENHGGAWINKQCHYFAYVPESAACQASTVGCRAYTGNSARNLKLVVDDDFEGGPEGWATSTAGPSPCDSSGNGVCQSTEAVAQGGHSLKIAATSALKVPAESGNASLTSGKTYMLTFWAKGSGDLTAYLVGNDRSLALKPFGTVALSTDWRTYSLGPIVYDNARGASDYLSFVASQASGSRPVFVDNVQLAEVTDNLYLIENSWRTPASCDRDTLGRSSPQYMLGCQAYTDRARQPAYFRNFARICRPEAVGCSAVYDTQNSASPYAQTYNAVCYGRGACASSTGEPCHCVTSTGSCDIRPGESYCTYNTDGAVTNNLSSNGETRVVPADALTYYVYDSKYSCPAAALGCSKLGVKTLDAENRYVTAWTPAYLKDLPDSYGKTLCNKTEEGCQAYKRVEDSTPVFFKDPGNHVCEFKTNVQYNGQSVDGWFRKGTTTPCYSDYLVAGSSYGIWKNDDPDYDGWTGICPSEQSRCKEFLDTTDKSASNPQGRAYYFLKNERLDLKSCAGQVSRQKSPSAVKEASACALFRQSDDVNLKYDATASYRASEAQFGALVSPVSDADNDTNVIIRAKRDRQCAEWYDCRSSEKVYNPTTGEFKDTCTAIAPCVEYQKTGDTTKCVKYADSSYSGQVLNDKVYESRPTGWGSKDYSGYAVPYRYPLNELSTVDVAASGETADPRLVYANGTCSGNYVPCGSPNNRGRLGTCINGQCLWPIDGGPGYQRAEDLRQASGKAAMAAADCRAYPSETAPFPGSVADPGGWDSTISEINDGNPRLISPAAAFQGANVCQRRVQKIAKSGGGFDYITYDSCECGYIKASYGSTDTKYFPLNGPDIPYGYCQTGTFEGLECDPNAQGLRSSTNLSCCNKLDDSDSTSVTPSCADDGECKRLSKTDYVVGFQGQCVERDLSTPINGTASQYACLTWRPTGLIGGAYDIHNLNTSAGYFAPVDRHFYCAEAGGTSRIELGIQRTISGDTNTTTGSFADTFCYGSVGDRKPVGPSPFDVTCYSNAYCKNLPTGNKNSRGEAITYDAGPCIQVGHCEANAQTHALTNTKCFTDHDCSISSNGGTGKCLNVDPVAQCVNNGGGLDDCKASVALNGGGQVGPGNGYSPELSSDNSKPLSDQGPKYQPANRFFGPGVVSQMVVGYRSNRGNDAGIGGDSNWPITGNCAVAADKTGSAWCIFPGLSTACEPQAPTPPVASGDQPGDTTGNNGTAGGFSCPVPGVHSLQTPLAYGIVGCYEVSDNTGGTTAGDPLTIQWPYVGPPIYRDQLQNFEVDLAQGIYENETTGNEFDNPMKAPPASQSASSTKFWVSPTNPYQRVDRKCNDNGGDSHISDKYPNPLNPKRCYLDDSNKWKNDCADRDGSDVFELLFDKYGALRALKLTASDLKWQGTFGITAIAFNFKQACGVVNRVDQPGALGLTQANTEYVNSYRQFSLPDPIVGTTNYVQACRPWGNVGLQSQDPPTYVDSGAASRWTRITLNPMKDGQEVRVDQCTEISYRRASSYNRGTLGTLFHATGPAWQYAAMNVGDVDYGGQLLRPLYSKVSEGYVSNSQVPPYAPQIASVDTTRCSASGSCAVKSINAFAINGHDNGVLTGYGGAYSVTAQFYAWASHNSMPVVQRKVDWNDSVNSEPPAVGWYKNHKPYCSPDESDKNAVRECAAATLPGLTCQSDVDCPTGTCATVATAHFGNVPGACETDPYQFEHTYTCSLGDLESLGLCNVSATTDQATNAPCRRQFNGAWACVYRPDIRVQDNWGYENRVDFGGEIRLYPTAEDALAFGQYLAGNPTICGDNRCEAGETNQNCPTDCYYVIL